MNDLPNAPTDDLLPAIAADALVQAKRLIELDGPRAEAWGSDLAALALEAGEDGVVRLVAALAEASGPAAAAALWALSAVTEVVDLGDSALKPAPTWASSLGTSRCVEAMILRERRWESVAFRFVDSAEDAHVIVVGLVPPAVGGGDETVGEVNLGAVDLLDVLQEEDAGIVVVETALELAAGVDAAPSRLAPAPLLLTLLLFLAADAEGGLRSRFQALGRDILFANFAGPEVAFLDLLERLIDLVDKASLPTAEPEGEGLDVLA